MAATVFTNAGRALTTARATGSGATPTYVAWGTGAGDLHDALEADTALYTPSAETRVAGTCTCQTTSTSNDTWQLVATIVSLSNQSIAEAGCFDAPSSGTCFLHATFSAVPVLTGDQLTFTFKLALA